MSRQACPGRHPKSKDKAEKILRGWFAEFHSWKFLDKLEKGLLPNSAGIKVLVNGLRRLEAAKYKKAAVARRIAIRRHPARQVSIAA
jgi:hypothetical protein